MSAESKTTTVDCTRAPKNPQASQYVCSTCRSYLAINNDDDATSSDSGTACAVCQDLWNPKSPSLKQALEQSCEVYGGTTANHFSTSSITVSLPGELNLNYRLACRKGTSAKPFSDYAKDLKLFLVQEVQKLCKESHEQSSLPPILSIDEQGFLMIHLQCAPPKRNGRMMEKKKKQRQRWRPFVTQGGDPRVNLESRLQQQGGYQWYSMADAEKLTLSNYQQPAEMKPMEYHFAVFRKPIYIYGYYTKGRRDVSQSPFVVMREQNGQDGTNNGSEQNEMTTDANTPEDQQPPPKKRKIVAEALGVTSVEEQICNPIVELLGGISTQNSVSAVLPSQEVGDASHEAPSSSNVRYGMCKFHASGREDMDVRMLIRPNSNTLGRPFCVQLIDSKQALQSQDQLNEIAHRINHTTNSDTSPEEDDSEENSKLKSALWHGQNPYGVGVCPEKLCVAPASAYSNLQSDTESKVKHYGCHCWSERILPKGDGEEEKITALLFPELKLPLTIQQRTPLRVVHRRANLVRERQILRLDAWRVDDHHFRLEMSTQAGTYIKEFVHGDLLRTHPSIASILGCKTNLLLLDCEGIELTDSPE